MVNDAATILALDDLHFGFPTRTDFLGPVTLSIHRGELWAIVGPNGAGKSTLLRLMAGFQPPHRGDIRLLGTTITSMPARRRAQRLAFLPQQLPASIGLTVRELVLMGRFPHRSMGLFESREDVCIAEQALELTGTLGLADRLLPTLSGGEVQRVYISSAIAQSPEIMLLDEPTASLDLHHQLAIFRILRERAARDKLTIVVVTHEVNLAARFCSHALLLDDGRVVASGPPRQVITPELLSRVYGVALAPLSLPGSDAAPWIVPNE
ncbi:MAG: ABC transporter ATP-binding protein [Phycisphaerae bacterium]